MPMYNMIEYIKDSHSDNSGSFWDFTTDAVVDNENVTNDDNASFIQV